MSLSSVKARKERDRKRKETRETGTRALETQKPAATSATQKPAATSETQKTDGNKEPKPNSDQGGGPPKVERKINPAPTKKAVVNAPDPGDVELERALRLDEHKRRLDNAEWNRRKRIEVLQGRVAQERKDAQRGNGFTRFTTTFNGRKARTVGSWRQTGGSSSSRGASSLTPSERELDRMLAGAGDGPGGLGITGRKSATLDWMPQDTSKDGKQRFGAADFFGRDNRGRSSRYAGGYLSAEFRENFINSRMEGLNPGDTGYDAARRKAEGAWGQAVKQYDRQFMQFGQEKLKEQSRLDFQQRRETMLKQQEEARQRQAEEQKKVDAGISDRVQRSTGAAYYRDARPENSSLTNRELEQAAAEAVRNSSMRTGVEARIVIGSGPNAIAAAGRTNGGSTTRVIRDADTQAFVNGDNLIGKSSITDVTSGQRRNRGLQIGDRVGGTEMNVARREQDPRLAVAGRIDEVMRNAGKQDAGTFELITGMKREESRKSAGGRYAGGGMIVFGDQKTFDTAVAQNQKKRRVLT